MKSENNDVKSEKWVWSLSVWVWEGLYASIYLSREVVCTFEMTEFECLLERVIEVGLDTHSTYSYVLLTIRTSREMM